MSTPEISPSVLQAIPMLLNFPQQRFWVDYDEEADVLYTLLWQDL